ncbi:hypothetical protein ACMFMF_004925 [Clarireedia jacksonii]
MAPLQFAQLPLSSHQTSMEHNSQQTRPVSYNLSAFTCNSNAYRQDSGAGLSVMQPYLHPNYQGPNFTTPQISTEGYQSHPQSTVSSGCQNTAYRSLGNAASHAHGDGRGEKPNYINVSIPRNPNQAVLPYEAIAQQNYDTFPQHQINASFAQFQQYLLAQDFTLSQQPPIVDERPTHYQPISLVQSAQQIRPATSDAKAQNMVSHEQARQQTTNFALNNRPTQWSSVGTRPNAPLARSYPQAQPNCQAHNQLHAHIQGNVYVQAQAQTWAQAQTQRQAQATQATQANQAFNSHLQNNAHPNYAALPNMSMAGTQQPYLIRSAKEITQSHTSAQNLRMLQSNNNGKRTAEDNGLCSIPKRRRSPTSSLQNLHGSHIQETISTVPSSVGAPSQYLQSFQQHPIVGNWLRNQAAQQPTHDLAMTATIYQNNQQRQSEEQSGTPCSTSGTPATEYSVLTNAPSHTPQLQDLMSSRSQNHSSAHQFHGPRQYSQAATYTHPTVNGTFHHESQQGVQTHSNTRLLNNSSALRMHHSRPRESAAQTKQLSSQLYLPANTVREELTPALAEVTKDTTKESSYSAQLSLQEVGPNNAQRYISAINDGMKPGSAKTQLRYKEDFPKSESNENGEGFITTTEVSNKIRTSVGQSTDKNSARMAENTTAPIQNSCLSTSESTTSQNIQKKKPRKPYTRKPKPREQTTASSGDGIHQDLTGQYRGQIIHKPASELQHADTYEAKLREALTPYMTDNASRDFPALTCVSNSTLPSVDEVKLGLLSNFINNLSSERPCPFQVEIFRSDYDTKTMKDVEDPLNVVLESPQISFGTGHTIRASCTLWTRRCRIMPAPEAQSSGPVQIEKGRRRDDQRRKGTPSKAASERWDYSYEVGVHIQKIRLNEIRIDDTNHHFHLKPKNAINGKICHSVEPTWYEIVRQLQDHVKAWSVPTFLLGSMESAQTATLPICVPLKEVPTVAKVTAAATSQRKNDCLTPEHIGDSPPRVQLPKAIIHLTLTPPVDFPNNNAACPTQVQHSRANGMQKKLGCTSTVVSQTEYTEHTYSVQPSEHPPNKPRLSHHPRQPEFMTTGAGSQQGAEVAVIETSITRSYAPSYNRGVASQKIRNAVQQGEQPQQTGHARNDCPVAAGSNSASPSPRNSISFQQSRQQIPSIVYPHLQQHVPARRAGPNTLPFAPNQS